MGLIQWIFNHKFLSFLTGTLLIQGYVLAAASYLRYIGADAPAAFLEAAVQDDPSDDQQPLTSTPSELESFIGAGDDTLASINPNDEPENAEIEADDQPPALPPVKVVKHTVGTGENLSVIWKKYGASHAGSLLAAKAFDQAGVSYKNLWVGEVLELEISEAGDIVGLKRRMKGGKTFILLGDSSNGYQGKVVSNNVTENERVVAGVIKSSLSEAALEQNVPYTVIDQLVDIFGSRVVFTREIQPGDEFTIVYPEQHCVETGNAEPGDIRAASLRVNGSMMAAVRYVGSDGKARYFNERGESLDQYFLRYPLQFSRISSVFAFSRFHPILNVRRPHNGVDFAAPVGTPVRTVGDGVVEFAGWAGGAGNTVKISHGSRWDTAYLHLSKISAGIKKGARVSRGQVIGAVGRTGLATGPHLHFSLYDRGKYVDPLGVALPVQTLDKNNLIEKPVLTNVVSQLNAYHELLKVSLALGFRES